MACNESSRVNVGDPDRSHKEGVSENKPQKQGLRETYLEVRCVVVPLKQSNVWGGKDAGLIWSE